MIYQKSITVRTRGRGTLEITPQLEQLLGSSAINSGICHIFIQHTSASLMLCENADPAVREDVENFLARLAPDGDAAYQHDTEGPDDMSAHLRSILTGSSLILPVRAGRLALGVWQGVYVYEHRHASHDRHVVITIQGE
jgi:secondary thiamine-phosphate synthase enzyme